MNIRSLVNKYEQLKCSLESNNVDIFSISETWLTEGVNSNILNINGYNFERFDWQFVDVDTGLRKRVGGLCIYYNKHLACDTSKWREFNISSPDLELQMVEFIREKARNVIFLNIYRPPNGRVENMIDHINLALSSISRRDRKDVVLMGDFNVNMLVRNADERKLLRFGQINNLEQLIKQPTRCTSTTANIIDLLFCDVTHVKSSGVIDLFISDHVPIFLIKKMKTKKEKNYTSFIGRTYRNYSADSLHIRINNSLNLDKFLEINDPEECWEKLSDSLVAIANELIPKKEYKVKAEKPAWLTDELLHLQKDRLFLQKGKNYR